jgi:hypothetical protein
MTNNLALQNNLAPATLGYHVPGSPYSSADHGSLDGPGSRSARQVGECPLLGSLSRLGNVRSRPSAADSS